MMMPLSPTPRVLAFDTSTVRGSVALLEGKALRAEIRVQSLQTHSAHLLKSINFLLDSLGWKLGDLNLVAVGNGPGSFTGIRIGIATALGIAQSACIPFVEVSSLDALAHQVAYLDGRVGVVLDAHRSQAYYAEYLAKGGRVRPVQEFTLIDNLALAHHLRERHLYLVGDHDVCRSTEMRAAAGQWPRVISADLFLAAEIGRLACGNRRKWRSGEYIMSEPTYIRPPDALKKKAN